MISPIADALREAFFSARFGGEEVSDNLREILGHSVKYGGVGIPDPRLSEDPEYSTYKVASEVLLG